MIPTKAHKIRTFDKFFIEKNSLPTNDIYLVLDNLRSAYNVGNIIRTADAIRVNKILLCGTTPTPDNPKVQKTAMGAEKYVDWIYYKYTEDAINFLKEKKVDIYALETTRISKNLFEYDDIKLPSAFIFGNEALGIASHILIQTKAVLEIPVYGYKNSLNVSNTTAILLYEIARKLGIVFK